MIRVRTNHCAIVPIDDPSVTESGRIILPDQAKDRTDHGIVKYVGPDCKYVSVLDHVIYGGFNGQLLVHPKEGRLIIVSEDFISAVVKADDLDSIEVEGLFYKDKGGEYFPATFESAIPLLAEAFSRSPQNYSSRFNVRELSRPAERKESQYRVMSETRK